MTESTPAPRADTPERSVGVARLRASADVRAVFAARCAAGSDVVTVHVRVRDDEGVARAAIVAGKAVGNAVARNRVKRRLRSAMRELALHRGTDYVVVGRGPALRAPYECLRSALSRASQTAWERCR